MTSDASSAGSEPSVWASDAQLGGLVEALRLGTEPTASAAAEEIGRRFAPLVRKYWNAQGCGDYADFFQEVMVRLFGALPALRDVTTFPGLFRRIVIGAAADYWRSRGPDGVHEFGPEHESAEASFDEALISRLVVRTYLEVLPPRERDVIELLYLHDLDPPEVAQRLSISAGAVRMTKTRALQRLREAVAVKM
jgi:RNA polymerase sigma factor (sigma-70 family)